MLQEQNTEVVPQVPKKAMDIKTEIVTVTPAMAEKWITKTNNVRGLNEYRAKEMGEQMAKGDWELNGESIKFDTTGNLIDGQHRLRAAIISGTSFQTIVVRNVKSANNVDTGYKRSLYQVLAHEGYTDSVRIGPAINYIINYRRHKSFRPSGKAPKVSVNEGVRFMQENPGLQDIYHNLAGTKNAFGRDSMHMALYFLFREATDAETVDKFYLPLISGVNLKADSPIYHLRERLIREHSSLNRTLPAQLYAGAIIKAWNQWMKKTKVKVFKYDYDKEGLLEIATK